MTDWADYRKQHAAELAARDIAPNELQVRYRDDKHPPTKRDHREQECAIIDALVEQGGIAAWHGDGVGCVAQMIDAQMQRAEAAEARAASAERDLVVIREYGGDELATWEREHARANAAEQERNQLKDALRHSEWNVMNLKQQVGGLSCLQCAGKVDVEKGRCLECDAADEELRNQLDAAEQSCDEWKRGNQDWSRLYGELQIKFAQSESALLGLRAEHEAIRRILPLKFTRYDGMPLPEQVQHLVMQHQHDDGRCRTWEAECVGLRARLEQLQSFDRELRLDALRLEDGEHGRMSASRLYELAELIAAIAAAPVGSTTEDESKSVTRRKSLQVRNGSTGQED